MAIYFIGAGLIITSEAFSVGKQGEFYIPIVLSVFLLFIGQAVLGGALLVSGFLPAWVGWVATLWSLAWMVILPIAMPKDMYFPWLHYVAPVIIGIMLLKK